MISSVYLHACIPVGQSPCVYISLSLSIYIYLSLSLPPSLSLSLSGYVCSCQLQLTPVAYPGDTSSLLSVKENIANRLDFLVEVTCHVD